MHPGLAGRPLYLDYNGTTPVDPAVVEAMLPFLTHAFGNPSSSHAYGRAAASAVAEARAAVAELIGAASGSVVFTGSGSEADALAITGTALAARRPGFRPHVVTQATEHPAVLAAVADLETQGCDVTVVGVDAAGRVSPEAVAQAITASTVLVSVMHANNETGVIQPVAAIAAAAHARGVAMHCDAAQSLGKIDVRVDDLGVDLLTVVGHKVYAPKGVAALWVRDGHALRPLIGGGGQEGGLRAGTENVASIVALGRAAQLAADALAAGETDRLAALRDALAAGLERALPGRLRIHGDEPRLPNTLSAAIVGTRALTLLESLDGLAASAGSACHAGQDAPSPVLAAMGVDEPTALATLRLSLGRWTTADDIAEAVHLIASSA